VDFSYRQAEWAAQAVSGAVRYDIAFDPDKRRWYLDASWKQPKRTTPTLEELRQQPSFSLDLNADHLAAYRTPPKTRSAVRTRTASLRRSSSTVIALPR